MVDAGDAARFLGEILPKTPRLGGIYIFPYGIVSPEIFKIDIDIGKGAETGPVHAG